MKLVSTLALVIFAWTTEAQTADFATKCAAAGVIACFAFDDQNDVYYTWDGSANPSGGTPSPCDSDPILAIHGWHGLGRNRTGPGNAQAVTQNGACIYPKVDKTIAHSGPGSLKFSVPTFTGANSSGFYSEPFKRLTNGNFDYVAPGAPLGNVVYIQFYQRMSAAFIDTDFQCIGGTCYGWKQALFYGNPPNGSSSSTVEITLSNGGQRNVPQVYGQQGHDDYGIEDIIDCTYQNTNASPYGGSGYSSRPAYYAPYNSTCEHYMVDQWAEYTLRIDVNGPPSYAAGCGGGAQSRVQMWFNGKLVVDNPCASINYGAGDGDGIGQFMLTPYHTNKDPAHDHPTAYTWYDDLIISTQPISMGSDPIVPDILAPGVPQNLQVN